MAVLVYFYDAVAQRYRSIGGPELTPPNISPNPGPGFGLGAFGLAPFGQ